MADAYVNEIKSLRKEINRLNDSLKDLRHQRKIVENHLYLFMKKNGTENLSGITINSITPGGLKNHRKKKSEKKRDAIQLFHQIGVPDPEKLWTEFQATQKYQNQEDIHVKFQETGGNG